jgi:hypothetical protein
MGIKMIYDSQVEMDFNVKSSTVGHIAIIVLSLQFHLRENVSSLWHRTAAGETLHFGCLAARLSVKDSLSCRRGTGSLTICMKF